MNACCIFLFAFCSRKRANAKKWSLSPHVQ
jgi:hypothetical protein